MHTIEPSKSSKTGKPNAESCIEYRVTLSSPQAHLFEVECTIPEPAPEGQVVSLPAWIPGSYMIRDFARNIVRISASGSGKPVKIEKTDKHTWTCSPCQGQLTLTYSVYAYDLSVRSAYFDTTRAYFNGTSLCLMVHGQSQRCCKLTIEKSAKPYRNWQVGTAMPPYRIDKQGFGSYLADGYEALIDHPVEIGDLAIAKFKVKGIPHRLIVSGRHRADLKRLAHDLKQLCSYHIGFFGEAPFKRYDFLLYVAGDDQYGGLEHANSTSLMCPRSWLPVEGEPLNQEHYQDLLGLCSHEYFHAWHVKRIRPQAFIDATLHREAYTRQLWIFEGFTAYYDSLFVLRSGLISREDYLRDLSQSITRLLRTPGRHVQLLEDSSFDAWIKLYKPDENTPNAQVSYYLKGSLTALALDLTLREAGHSLDEVMHALWQRYGRTGQGLQEGALAELIAEVTGVDVSRLLKLALHSQQELPLARLLAAFGIACETTPEKDHVTGLGLRLATAGEARIATVFSGGAAEQAGLAGGDVVVAIDGIKATAKNFDKLTSQRAVGSKLKLHAFRRDELMVFDVRLQAASADRCKLSLKKAMNRNVRLRLNQWLSPATD